MKYNLKEFENFEIPGFTKFESNIFKANGYETEEEVQRDFPDLYRKFYMPTFLSSMRRLKNEADFKNYLEVNYYKKFVIIGDYDTDGIMATTIMKAALQKLDIKVDHLIPDRLIDGYGLSKDLVDQAIELNAEVIITVDNGITAFEAVDYAKEKGLTVLITDHHLPESSGKLPNADYIFNPHLTDPDLEISGAFVALKLITQLFNEEEEKYFLNDMAVMAGISTIADMMPLVKENRLLVKLTIDQFNFMKGRNIWAGLTLKIMSGLGAPYANTRKEDFNYVDESTIAFYISPTINAQGRVNGNVNSLVDEILESQTPGKYIDGKAKREVNYERKRRTRELMKEFEATDQAVEFYLVDQNDFDFSISGLIGLAANDVLSRTGKPSFVGYVDEEADRIVFSGRAPQGSSLFTAFSALKENFKDVDIRGGGHDGALGMSLPSDGELYEAAKSFMYTQFKKIETPKVDSYILHEDELDKVTSAIKYLAPFGKGFELPKFMMNGNFYFSDANEGERPNIIKEETGLEFERYPGKIKEGKQDVIVRIETNNPSKIVLGISEIIGTEQPEEDDEDEY